MKYIGFIFVFFALILTACSDDNAQQSAAIEKKQPTTVSTPPVAKEKPAPVASNIDPELLEKANNTLAAFISSDPGINTFFKKAYGYAVFPTIGKAGLGVGGAHGKGVVYKQGITSGSASMTQITVGLQVGVQEFSEVIFFEKQENYKHFVKGNYEAGAQVSAVLIKKGAAAQTKYSKGIAIFVQIKDGLMAEASVGGQKFTFKEKF